MGRCKNENDTKLDNAQIKTILLDTTSKTAAMATEAAQGSTWEVLNLYSRV